METKGFLHHEKAVHIFTAAGFIITGLLFLAFPSFFDLRIAMVALFLFLGTKTLANVIIDTHIEETYHKKGK